MADRRGLKMTSVVVTGDTCVSRTNGAYLTDKRRTNSIFGRAESPPAAASQLDRMHACFV